jgi:hypothetical protein
VWNLSAGELWRRTRIALDRALQRIANDRGVDAERVRLSYGKVAEMQRRGIVHFHAIIRLDDSAITEYVALLEHESLKGVA